jgi:lysophospholipase L1-like esterase
MKTVLCYGDSLTWGYNPSDGARYPFGQRWPGVLQRELGDGVRVIEEALSGRTAATDSWLLPDRNGRTLLAPLLESHAPLDLVIIMLGTNDLAPSYHRTAAEVAFGCASLIWTVQKSRAGPGGGAPECLLIAPPPLGKLSEFMGLFFQGGEGASQGLAQAYEVVARACGCHFLDSARFVRASEVDGVHLEPPEHRALALAVKKVVAPILAQGVGPSLEEEGGKPATRCQV